MNFNNYKSLKNVEALINEANAAFQEPNRNLENSPISNILKNVLKLGAGSVAGLSFASLFSAATAGMSAPAISYAIAATGTTLGGAAVSGLFVLALPAGILATTVFMAMNVKQREKLQKDKEALIIEALIRNDAIIRELKEKVNYDYKRAAYLGALRLSLKAAVDDLAEDLKL